MQMNENLNESLDKKADSILEQDLMPTSSDLEGSKLSAINPKQQRVVHLHLSGLGMPDIAEITGYSRNYVRNLLRSDHIKSVIESVQAEEDEIVRQGIKALRMKALKKMSDLIDSRQDAIAYQAARDVLDRTGHKGTVKQEVNVNVTFEQQLNELLKDSKIIEVDDYTDIDD